MTTDTTPTASAPTTAITHIGQLVTNDPSLGEGPLELRRRDRDGLQGPQHVREPQPDEADVALLERPEHELLLLLHAPILADTFLATG